MISRGPSVTHLAAFVNGNAYKPQDFGDTGIPVVRIKQLLDPSADLDLAPTPVRPVWLTDGDLVFSWSATLAVRFWNRGKALLNQHLFRVDVRPSVDRRWFAYVLEEGTKRLEPLMHGSAMTHITLDMLKSVTVALPSLETQVAMADYLDRETARIDALIAAKRRMVGLLEERAVAYIEDSALDAPWTMVPLSRAVVRIEQGWSPQCDARLPDENEWGVLKVGCVNRGEFRAHEAKALPPDLSPRTEYLVANGDLLMSRANTRDLVGSTAVVSGVRPRTLLCDKLYRIRRDERKANPRFVSLWLQTRAARGELELDATGASDSMQNIGQDTVRRVPMPLPDREQQDAFVARCDRERAQIAMVVGAIQKQVSLLFERRQALITAAVTGQLDIPEAA